MRNGRGISMNASETSFFPTPREISVVSGAVSIGTPLLPFKLSDSWSRLSFAFFLRSASWRLRGRRERGRSPAKSCTAIGLIFFCVYPCSFSSWPCARACGKRNNRPLQAAHDNHRRLSLPPVPAAQAEDSRSSPSRCGARPSLPRDSAGRRNQMHLRHEESSANG